MSEIIDVDDGLGKCLRSFLRHIVTDAVEDSVRVFAGELSRVGFSVGGCAVEVTGNRYRRDRDHRSLEQLLLERVITRLTFGEVRTGRGARALAGW